jgi:hypothetical protein
MLFVNVDRCFPRRWPTLALTRSLTLSLRVSVFISFHIKTHRPQMFMIIEIQDSFVFGCSHFISVALTRNTSTKAFSKCHLLNVYDYRLYLHRNNRYLNLTIKNTDIGFLKFAFNTKPRHTYNNEALILKTKWTLDISMEFLLKGLAQYSWPPCTNQFRPAAFNTENICSFFTKHVILTRRSTVLSNTLQ